MAESKKVANEAFDLCTKRYEANYPKAIETLTRYRDAMLAFYDFPAENYGQLGNLNSIGLVLALIRHQGISTKNCGSR
jgi:transposase-like protein